MMAIGKYTFNTRLVTTECLALVVQMVDNAIHWINLYPVESAIGFPNIYMYPLDSDLSGG